jgi:2-dehydropantoate 2-reductase
LNAATSKSWRAPRGVSLCASRYWVAGAVGGFFGGLLARSGQDVTFIARGAQLEAIRARGLAVKSPTIGDFTVSGCATDNPREVGPVDLVLVGVKTYDLDAAAAQLEPLIGPETVVLPLQNGIEATDRIARAVGPEPLLTGVAYVLTALEAPGVVKHIAQGMIILGEPEGGPSPRVERVAEALRNAGISCETPSDIRVPLWAKFVLLTATGGVAALMRLAFGPIRECAEASELFRAAMQEADTVGRAHGVALPAGLVDGHWQIVCGLPASAHGSMLQDLRAGRRLELEALNGSVVRLGQEVGVPTPLNFAVYAALKPYADGSPAPPS